MKKFLTILLDFILIVSIVALCGSLSLNQMMTNTITTEAIGNVVSQKVADTVKEYYPNVDDEKVAEVQQQLQNSSTVNQVTNEYIQSIVDAATTGENVQLPNMSEDINQIIDDNTSTIENELGVQITDEQKQQIKNEATQKSNEIQSQVENEVNSYIQDESQPVTQVLKTYQKVQSKPFQIGIGILAAIACLLIIALSKFSSGLQNIGVSGLISGISMILIVPMVMNQVVHRFLGESMNVDFTQLTHDGYIVCIVAIVCFVVGVILRKKRV